MSEKKRKAKTFKKDFIYVALALIGIGTLFVLMPGKSSSIICYTVASLLCVWGIIKLFMYFAQERKEIFSSMGLVSSVALIILGISIFITPAFFEGVIATVFGFVMIVDGVLKLQYSLDILRLGAKNWWIIMIISGVFVVAGLVVVFNPLFSAKALMMFAGICLIVNGVSDLYTAFFISRILKKVKAQEEVVVRLDEGDYKDIED